MAEAGGLGEIAEDRLLDGRLKLHQPKKGHRAGSDAVLLAAALPAAFPGALVDFGAGVGTVGLAAALLRPDLLVTLVERDPDLAALAAGNVALNGLSGRVEVVAADVAALAEARLAPASFGCVAMNPPFFSADEAKPSPVANRRAAHVADQPLALWLKAARRLLKPGGHVAIIHRAEALADILAGLATGFGGVAIRPVHAAADKPAIRVVVTAELGSRRPLALLPGFVLNGPDGRFTELSEAVHRGRAALPGG
ncbi:methyltransferase domain-containing protein [Bosea caraganae]|uniref:Methyltransferase domain-containing protein n=1 Tax=Bosea caraganae TaxID=2763117 RepID=A0A370L4H3_9HYPH|nr:methyltransferase [Bosea caraganae]RDJ23595.1 methyltransferase domain-containing protein [Bosea caraganae]RDJ24411.1 methyltransferase domain-containing protein [Bosea caraganae]